MFKINPLTQADFYKMGHKFQYPVGTTKVYSNFTPRSSRLARVLRQYYDEKVVFFGLQGFIKWFLIDTWNSEFFNRPKDKVVAKYKRRMDTSLGVGAVPVDHIEALHDLGYLPIKIKALPEGSRVNIKVPMFTIENTHPDFFWVTNYLETATSAESWKACTTATIAYEYRKIMEKWAVDTGAPLDFVGFQCHDFSMRGVGGIHDAAANSAGHMLSFVGSDVIPAIDYLEEYYNADAEKELIGTSVPATEHSVMSMGYTESEVATYRRLLTEVYPSGLVSIVSDTVDYWNVITKIVPQLKEEILNRQPNAFGMAKFVVRPDSGDPVRIICGYDENEVYPNGDGSFTVAGEHGYGVSLSDVEVKGSIQCLWDTFGGTITDKGYKVLHERIGLIYGDSITLERAEEIQKRLAKKGFASCNVVFGVGSYTYQYATRDSFGFAMKSTYGEINDQPVEIFKDPVTDSGVKKSAKGLLSVSKWEDDFILQDQCTRNQEEYSLMEVVFEDGKLMRDESLSQIRARLLGREE